MRAIITGATSGIGLSIATEWARRGYDLILTGRRIALLEQRAHRLATKYSIEVKCYQIELSKAPERKAFIKYITDYHDISLVVNNAGFGTSSTVKESNLHTLTAMLATHCSATVELCYSLLPVLIKNRGAIINVSSPMGDIPMPSSAIYCATKSFITRFTEVLALELRGRVRVMALLPGLTYSDFHSYAHSLPVSGWSRLLWMKPQRVARYGMRMLAKKKIICIPGVLNRAVIAVIAHLPRVVTYGALHMVYQRLLKNQVANNETR